MNNPNYHLLYDLTFNIFLGLKYFRSGIRKNNLLRALARRQKVSPIMFIGNHHIYKFLVVNDMKTGVQATKEVADYISKSFTTWRSYPSKLDYSKSKSSSVSQKS